MPLLFSSPLHRRTAAASPLRKGGSRGRRNAVVLGTVAAGMLLTAAAPAAAATASLTAGTLTVTDQASHAGAYTVGQLDNPLSLPLLDKVVVTGNTPITPAPSGCVYPLAGLVNDTTTLICNRSAVTRLQFDLGDGDDSVSRPLALTLLGAQALPLGSLPVTLNGGDGSDLLQGGDGADTINGGDGDDQLFGFGGDDTINGGLGADVVEPGSGTNTVDVGTPEADTVNVTAGSVNNVTASANDLFFGTGATTSITLLGVTIPVISPTQAPLPVSTPVATTPVVATPTPVPNGTTPTIPGTTPTTGNPVGDILGGVTTTIGGVIDTVNGTVGGVVDTVNGVVGTVAGATPTPVPAPTPTPAPATNPIVSVITGLPSVSDLLGGVNKVVSGGTVPAGVVLPSIPAAVGTTADTLTNAAKSALGLPTGITFDPSGLHIDVKCSAACETLGNAVIDLGDGTVLKLDPGVTQLASGTAGKLNLGIWPADYAKLQKALGQGRCVVAVSRVRVKTDTGDEVVSYALPVCGAKVEISTSRRPLVSGKQVSRRLSAAITCSKACDVTPRFLMVKSGDTVLAKITTARVGSALGSSRVHTSIWKLSASQARAIKRAASGGFKNFRYVVSATANAGGVATTGTASFRTREK